jgi:hypothetical protein
MWVQNRFHRPPPPPPSLVALNLTSPLVSIFLRRLNVGNPVLRILGSGLVGGRILHIKASVCRWFVFSPACGSIDIRQRPARSYPRPAKKLILLFARKQVVAHSLPPFFHKPRHQKTLFILSFFPTTTLYHAPHRHHQPACRPPRTRNWGCRHPYRFFRPCE